MGLERPRRRDLMLMATRVASMPNGRSYVEFHEVRPEDAEVHARLENWARWCRNRPGLSVHPMFRGAKSGQDWEPVTVTTGVNTLDAQRIEKGVARLPYRPQHAVRWAYVFRTAPRPMAASLGVSLQELADLVDMARVMLVNRS